MIIQNSINKFLRNSKPKLSIKDIPNIATIIELNIFQIFLIIEYFLNNCRKKPIKVILAIILFNFNKKSQKIK
jgi:hypothetical protein